MFYYLLKRTILYCAGSQRLSTIPIHLNTFSLEEVDLSVDMKQCGDTQGESVLSPYNLACKGTSVIETFDVFFRSSSKINNDNGIKAVTFYASSDPQLASKTVSKSLDI